MRFTVWGRSADRIEIWECWFLRRRKNQSTRRKISQRKDENQQTQFNPHMISSPGIEPGPQEQEFSFVCAFPKF